ncbi:low temperature requirement protein A [Chloroflexi bacterium TSY]|nr:low temperature requirement protein A [Chloroflexi bacterium TSY]
MHSIWRPPYLHTEQTGEEERKVTWLELFYDLVYVATIIQMGNLLSHHVSWLGFLEFIVLFIPIWWSWTGITFYMNRFVVDDIWHRLLIFLQIFAIGTLGLSVQGAFADLSSQFALSYVAIRVLLILMYVRAWVYIESARPLVLGFIRGFSISSLIWLISAFVPAPFNYLLWAIGMVIDLITPFLPGTREHLRLVPADLEHLSERYGIFTIIVLGESFIKIITQDAAFYMTWPIFLFSCAGLTVTYGLWWLYFDDVADSKIRMTTMRNMVIWLYSHLPLAIGITAFGVAAKKLIFSDLSHAAKPEYRWLYTAAIVLYLIFVAIIDEVTEREDEALRNDRRAIWRFVAAVVLLIAFFGATLTPTQFVALIAPLFVIQVVIDLPWRAR